MAKKAAKKAMPKQEAARVGDRNAGSKVDDPAVKEYREKYEAWEHAARKVLAAEELMELAGGYKEAFVLLDAVIFSAEEETRADVRAAGNNAADSETKAYGVKMKACEDTARKVLAAKKLIELASGQEEAFMLLDAVMIAIEGEQGHEQAAEAHSSCASHHEAIALTE